MVNRILLVSGLLTLGYCCRSQSFGSRAEALGEISSVLQGASAASLNPAGAASIHHLVCGVAVSRVSGDPPIMISGCFCAMRIGRFTIGVDGLSKRLAGVYHEQRLGIMCAGTAGKRLAFGTRLNTHSLGISLYGQARAFSIESGMTCVVSGSLLLGAFISNPFSQVYRRLDRVELPQKIAIGSSGRISEAILFVTEFNKEAGRRATVAAGLEYGLMKQVFLRMGLRGFPGDLFAGFGTVIGRLELDMSYSSSPNAGIKTQFSMCYDF